MNKDLRWMLNKTCIVVIINLRVVTDTRVLEYKSDVICLNQRLPNPPVHRNVKILIVQEEVLRSFK